MSPNSLPEGTDSIINDPLIDDIAGSGSTRLGDPGFDADAPYAPVTGKAPSLGSAAPIATARDAFADARDKASEKVVDFKGQAADKLRAYAVTGKDKASESIHGVSRLIEDAAAQIDDKVGAQYGDYARQAAQALAGFADNIDGKDVDELFDQARDVVRKSPGIAVGAAAAIGFVLSRVARAGVEGTTPTGTPVGVPNPAPRDVA